MTKRALTMLVVAILLVGGATAVIASTLAAGGNTPTHSMPGGQTMSGSEMNMGK